MKSVFTAYLILEKSAVMGMPIGAPLEFPTTTEAVQKCFSIIGVDGIVHDDYAIAAFDSPIKALGEKLPIDAKVDELNYFANLIADTDHVTLEFTFSQPHIGANMQDLLDQAFNIPTYIPGVVESWSLGERIFKMRLADAQPRIKELLRDFQAVSDQFDNFNEDQLVEAINNALHAHMDFGATGVDFMLDYIETGFDDKGFYGYPEREAPFKFYQGLDSIPGEYRVFAYPDRRH